MSTQSYYRDRLGFDQNEWNDGVNTPIYEANLSKSKDERDAIQKKTFTKWVNKHLKKAGRHVNDLFEDLQDGHNLLSLLEVLSGQNLPRERGRLRFHMLQNIQMCLNFLRHRKIKLVNIRAEDIVDGNPKLTLGLIWTIILHFQISDIVVGQEPNVSPRDVLLRWAKRTTSKYSGVRVGDFTSSWRDGLAFNAIIHRNRPDLVDWRTIRQRQIRERLENAFHVAEREYGVTRLLDVEDVDTNEPDEKSLITYISSLYDVFPDPPVNHPLLDSESQQRTNTYREMANSLHLWIREKILWMQDRTFPNTLIEVKKLATESSRFRNEDIPSKQREKQRLNNAFRELTKFYDSIGEIDIEPELHIETIEKNWSRLLIAHQEKDQAIQDELKRLEKLQRLAEKVHREMKQVDSRLEELEQRVEMEAARLDRLHPLDAKNIVDQLEHDIRLVEENIQFLFTDVQILREGRYAQSSELHKRVERLHQRWVQLRSLLHSRLITPLSSISFPIEERTVTRQTRTVLETRLVDTNTHFRQLQECTEWVKNKLTHIGDGEYGSDLPGAQAELELMQREHKTVEQFQTKIQQCVSAKNNFHGEELQLYSQHLNMLQKLYAELLVLSNKRLSDLETLQDFLQSATNELVWLNEKEDTEVSRDWSDKNLNLGAVHHYYESLMSELERREIQFSAVVDRGEALVLQRHPASKCIEAYMTALQNQWSWVLQLTLCLETHLKHTQTHQQFYSEVKEAETWITKRDEMLNTIYSQSEFSLDEGERLLKGMQDLREELNHYGDVISQLAETSKDVAPLKQRRQPVTKPIKVRAVCDYKQANIHINKNESCVLHDNSGRIKWRVTNLSGVESNIPGVVLTIPPPDKEAIDAVDRLRRQFDRSVALWQKKQLRMRQNMIFATIKVVKTWDLAQFIAMGQEQRTAIRRALNDDADKLISEGDPSDPQLRRLRREIDEVNRLFDEFEKRARDDEESKNMSRVFENQITSLQIALDEAESTLNARAASPLPRDLDSLEHLVIQHKEFESRLQTLNVRVDEVQRTYREITRKTSQQETKLKKVLVQWDTLWHSSRLYVERLKCIEILLSGLDEASNTVSEFEHKLSSYTHMPSEIKQLQQVHEELIIIQTSVTSQQHIITQLREDVHNTRRVVEESRKHKGPYDDLNRIESDVNRLANRWSSVVNQLTDRLRTCESAYGNLQKFSGAYEAEVTFVEDSYSKLNTSQEVEQSKGMYTNVIERTQHIEQVNISGGRYIREAKIYDHGLEEYVTWLVAEVHPSLDGALKVSSSKPSGADDVAGKLDRLNNKFQQLLATLRASLKDYAGRNPQDKATAKLLAEMEPKPLKTFRTEFNISEAVTTYTSTERFSSSETVQFTTNGTTNIQINGDSPLNKRIKREQEEPTEVDSPRSPYSGSTMEFTEIKSLKRIQRVEEGIGTDSVIDCLGIIHPETEKMLTVGEAIRLRILDVRTGMFNTIVNNKITPISIETAVKYGLIDAKLAEKLLGPCGVFENEREISLLEAIQQNISEAESGNTMENLMKQAMEEKYRVCDDALQKLLQWVGDVEHNIAQQDVVQEDSEHLRNQINIVKAIKDDIHAHNRPVTSCLDQVRQIVATGGEVLSSEEISSLEKNGQNLKKRFDRVQDRSEKLLKKLIFARDELSKFKTELSVFCQWMDKARRALEEKERILSDLTKLSSSAESIRDFVSDVIVHQADLRFITMSAQKFVDESKEYLTCLNEFRTSLPQRLPHIEPVSSQDSMVRNEVSLATTQYRDLLSRSNALSDKLSGLGGRQREYRDALEKARAWLKDAEPRATKLISEPVGADLRTLEEQLARAKSLNSEFVANGRLIDNAKQAVTALLRSLEGQQSPAELEALEAPVREIEYKYLQLSEALAERLQILDTALVQSQGVQDALDSLIQWLNTMENQLKSLMKPASLNKERLDEQLREQRLIHAEIESHRASLESVAYSAQDLINNSSNSRLASKIQAKLSDVLTRYEKIQLKTLQRGDFLDEISQSLSKFNVQVEHFEQWYADLIDQLESRDLNKLNHEEFALRIDQFITKREKQRNHFDEMINNGKNLIAKKDVTDVGVVREKIKALENLWRDLNISLEEKQKASRARAEQLNAYERLRDSVLDWLNNFESRVNRLEVVALDLNILKRQSDDLKPLIKEYRDYAATLDKLNDLGSAYDSLTRSDSPSRRRSAYSPAKRQSVARRSSQDGRSPSPTKNYAASPVSPSGSSGFSSRRSSQENFHLEELSPVQQQLSEINHRYSLLGVKLNDRQTEIDTMREEVKKYLDNIRALGQFLDKVQRQLPKESVPMTRDESDKAAKAVKIILEEMYEKQSLLDNTRSQVKDLLRRKAGASGADTLHDELEDVTSRWKSLNDRCKSRIKLFEDLKDFHDTHDNLSNWLSAKDRMMSVLGPISSDSRMVQSQVQQVQVLREEFKSQQPQLQHLTEIGESILSQVDKSSADGQRLAARLSAILQRWADLLGRLEERASSLGAAADTSREFDAGVARLRDALQAISDQLDDLPLDKDPEEQLRKIQNLERQLEGQRPLLADIEAAGAHLSEVLTDPASRAEIQSKLQGLARQYNTLQKKLDHRKAEIEGSLRDGRQLEQSCARTVGWLAEELGSMSERLLVSADRHVLQQQLEHHEPIYKEVMNKEHEIIMLLNKAKDALNRTTQRSDTRNLQRDVDKIQQLWDKLRKETVDRQTRLQTCMEHCKKYYRGLDTFLPWLNIAEDKLEVLKPATFKKKDIEKQLKELSAFRNEVWKHSGEYENSRMLGETFQGACDIDKEVVRNELTTLKQRWDKLNNDLLGRTQNLEDTARLLSDFNENLRELEHSLQRCEDKLSNHDASDPKLLEKIKGLKEETTALKKPLQALRQQASDLVAAAGEIGVDASHLQDEVDVLSERLEHLSARLDDRCSELQSAATAVQQFNEQVKSLGADLSALEQELDAMKPPGRDLKTVRSQLDEIARFIKKINKAADDVSHLVSAGEQLVDSGFAPDTLQTREQAESLRRSLARLDERARNREEDLDNTLQKLEQFYQLHTTVMEDIQEAQEQVRRLKPVGSEVEGIKAQQEESRVLRRNVVEPLSHQVSDCNRKGQTLIQSAAGGVNTSQMEKDLEKMNEKWNQLKEKMNERDRKLDVGLLQSGKFQEALDGLAKWLSDTEEMVANQKPPSADYKVVKAQLQEQKFLKKMLLDRQNSMSSLFAMGQEVAAGADQSERKAIERQLKELMGRFDNLTEGAQRRMLDLEQAMRVAKDFQDKLVPIIEWLDKTEKKVKDMELVPTDEEKIQQRIKEHDVLHNEILRKKPSLMELTEIADNLMSLVGEDEATIVADKLHDTAERYSHLCDASDAVGQLLQASRAGLRHLVLTYQDLQAWMEAMEKRLNSHRALGVHTEKLLQQMDDLADLTEEISNRHTQIDSTVDAGLELMKHISNDEAIQLKDKLDSLQRRYNDLTSRGAELLKNAQEALPLVQQFHNCHHRLVDWMMGAETQLQREPRQEEIARLEADIQEFRPVLESINLVGPQLCQLSPGEGAATIEGLVTRDNRRFDAIAEQIQRKAERFNLSKQRSLEVTADMDELLEWFREVENTLREVDPPSSDPDAIRAQLKEHRALQDDVTSQKSRGRDVISTAKKVLREASQHDDTTTIREKLEDLREIMDIVSALSSDRLGVLEQALPLAEHFLETHTGLVSWLDDIEAQVNMLALPALRPDQIAQQQDRNEMFIQWISDQKPLVDKLNKTGEALIRLVNDDDGAKVQDVLDADNARYAALRTQLRQRQQALEQALQDSSRFSDKLEGMLRALQNTAEQIKGAEPVSAHPPKIRDQLEENNALCEDLDTREEAFEAVKRAADEVINKAGNRSDPAVKDIKRKLDKLNTLWKEVQKATSDRGKTLDEALAVAEKFWRQLQTVMASLRDLSTSLNNQEPPAAQKEAIKVQQELLQEIKQEIDQTKPEVEQVRQTGHTLMKICGEPDKPEVKKHIEDLDSAWDNITALYARREENLIDAMEKAMEFHYTLQNLLEFLERAEDKFANMGPLGSDIDAVKKQISQLKSFKDEVDPQMVKVEALNRQAHELTERTTADQALAIKEPLNQVNRRWDELLRGMVERQRQLEQALLRLGQFQHALSELIKWIGITNNTLDNDLKPVPGDPQVLEVELAKLKVLVNDIQAHQSSVDALNDAGRQLIESSRGSQEASSTQEQLKTLNRQWRDLLQKAADRQRELEDSLKDAQRFHAEIQDLLSWLSDVDGVIAASKPVGGLPETASEQLQRFMEVFEELEANRPKVESVLQQGNEYLKRSSSATNLQHSLKTLKQRWDSVTARANDKKIKLEIALKEATEFHDALQAFVDWLTSAEKTLVNLKPVSRVMETILIQIEEHKSFQKEVSTHRETMLNLDKKGTHLKYFSQKQDVILIKNLLISVQHRWERVVSKSAERTRSLDHGYKEAKEFHEAWSSMMHWLTDTENQLDDLANETGNDPERIKQRLAKHREFQRALSGKQATYDATMRSGKVLKDKAPKSDEIPLREMLTELKNKWTTVCAKSVDRQRKLEEALLFSGQFKDAVSALMEWLQKADKVLSEEGPVHGDLDTVNSLVDQHRQFEEDLSGRLVQLEQVKKTGKDLQEKASVTDATVIRQQLSELTSLWDKVVRLKERRGKRLEEALKEAQQLHKSVDMLLEWLSDAEMKLRFSGVLPEDEQETRNQIAEHEKFLRELSEKERDKDATINLAQRILAKAHPDAVSVIKHWITIIQSRWDEVSSWARQRRQRLDEHIRVLRDADELLEELLAWLAGLEKTLLSLEAESLPEDIPTIEHLIADHKEFMENTQSRQGEVDSVCKSRQVQAATKDRKISRPKTPSYDREGSPDFDALSRKSSLAKSRESLSGRDPARRGSRGSPARDGRSDLPHYGPRFPPKGTKGVEPTFRNPRVKLLWDRWRNVWVLAWERQRRLQDRLNYLLELEKIKNFSWDEWRKRFLKFMNHKKSRLTDLFRKMDKNNDGLIPRDDFIDGIIKTKFDTSKLEMETVANLFDHNNGLIDWKEFIAALRPDWEERKPDTEADKIHDEVKRLVMLCTCRQKFRVFQVGEGKYRFGDSQKLRLVRILRSTVMVRVGGGWVALEEFLQKNDPCRAKGRTNIELREQFILADGVSQSMSAFKPKTSTGSRSTSITSGSAGPITKVRERSIKSVPMGSMKGTARSSFSGERSTPDSLSDNESGGGYMRATQSTARKSSSYRSSLTPGGSLPGSRNNSRPASRTGSKPPSRHGSNLSLDSTDDGTPSRIPRSSTLPRSRLNVPNGSAGGSRPRTPSGAISPAGGSRARTPSASGSTTPIPPGMSSAGSKLQRKASGASDISTSASSSRKGSKAPTPTDQRAPFRL